MKKEQEERKKTGEAEEKAARQAGEDQHKIVERKRKTVQQIMTILDLSKDGHITSIPDLQDVKISKTTAKSDFFLSDCDFGRLTGEKDGRVIRYNAYDMIEKSEGLPKHVHYGKQSLMTKIQNELTKSCVSHYAGYLKMKLDKEMEKLNQSAVNGAMEQVKTKLKEELDDSKVKLMAAERDFKTKQAKVQYFRTCFWCTMKTPSLL